MAKRLILIAIVAALFGSICFLRLADLEPGYQVHQLDGRQLKIETPLYLANSPFQIKQRGEGFEIDFVDSIGETLHIPFRRHLISCGRKPSNVTEYRGSYDFESVEPTEWNVIRLTQIESLANQVRLKGVLETHDHLVDILPAPFEVKIWHEAKNIIHFEAQCLSEAHSSISIHLKNNPEERVTGFGTQFDLENRNGTLVPILVSEQGIGRGAEPITTMMNLLARSGGSSTTTYAPQPFAINMDGWSIELENRELSYFDMRLPDVMTVQVHANTVKGEFRFNDKAKLVASRNQDHGLAPRPPDWTQKGVIVGLQGGTAAVLKKYKALKAANVAIAGVWIQDWVGQRHSLAGKQLWWNWSRDLKHYDRWETFTQILKKDGVRLLGYINPFLVKRDASHMTRHLYDEAIERSCLFKHGDGSTIRIENTSFSAGMVNIFDKACHRWLKDIIKMELIDAGFAGWMADYSEAMPFEATTGHGTGWELHNAYPVEWARLNREVIQELGQEDELFFFVRAGFTGAQQYASSFWLGDQMVDWAKEDGLASVIPALITSGQSGMVYNHADIGGYTTIELPFIKVIRSEELLLRAIELSAFTMFMRSHEGNLPEHNTQLYSTVKTREHIAFFSRLFRSLAPYRQHLMDLYEETGQPMILPVIDADNQLITSGFMLGAGIAVFPVMHRGDEAIEAYLPSGRWRHLFSEREFEGQQHVNVSAPIGQPAVFLSTDSEYNWAAIFDLVRTTLHQ